jgi:hypothetical protein
MHDRRLIMLMVASPGTSCAKQDAPRVELQVSPVQAKRIIFHYQDPYRLLDLGKKGAIGLWDVDEPNRPCRSSLLPLMPVSRLTVNLS